MPRRRKARSSSLELDSSSGGTRCGSASTMVTSAPKERQTLANSTPITPPPSTTTEAGTRSSSSAWSLVMTRSPSISRPGRLRDYEPVASTTCAPVYAWSPTWTVVGRDQLALALDDLDLAARDQARQALPQAGDDLVLVRVDPGHVDALEAWPGRRTPAPSRAWSAISRGVQQRLGGDAAPVQAGAADLVLLDQRDRLPSSAARSAQA